MARPVYCTDPHRTGLLGSWVWFVPLRVTADGRLQHQEPSFIWTEWDWKLFPAYMRNAAQHDPAPFVTIAVHDAQIRFEAILPVIREAQTAGLPQLWLEAEPLPKRMDQDFQINQDVICLLNPADDYSKRPIVVLKLAPEGDMFWNGERLNRAQVLARIGGREDPIIKIVPDANAKVTEVVQVMWEIAQYGGELMSLDAE
jgi:biopolymer transport protein ExbD